MDENSYNKEELIKKLEKGKSLTKKEERYYMKYVLNYTDEEINTIFAIANNKNPNKLID
ncbi:MAG: hypothetical protein WCO37_11595 [Bacteroidota bacterium]